MLVGKRKAAHFLSLILFVVLGVAAPVSTAIANPDCSTAYASPDSVWPPNHKYQKINIRGLSSSLDVVVQCIRQDEPLNSTGDGNTDIDGQGVGTSQASIRRERQGHENGRVYHIGFTATAIDGQSCAGEVQVGVPHSKKVPAVDDGPLYESTPGNLQCNTGENQNNPPIALDQSLSMEEDTIVAIILSGTDPELDSLAFQLLDMPTHGSLELAGSEYVYTPDADYVGLDQFSFVANDGLLDSMPGIVSLDVLPVNDRPLASDLEFTLLDNETISFVLPATDNDSPVLSYEIASSPAQGAVSGTAPNLLYTPQLGFAGAEQLIFKANDGELLSNFGTVTFEVALSNSPPVVDPMALVTDEDMPITQTVTGSDSDDDALTFSIAIQATNGTAELIGDQLTYVPNANFFGQDNLTLIANDGVADSLPVVVPITVNEINTAPAAISAAYDLLSNESVSITLSASDAENDTLTYSIIDVPTNGLLTGDAPELSYQPSVDYSGSDSFTFIANDGRLDSVLATLTITITKPNTAPIADSLDIAAIAGRAKAITLLGNDPDNDPLTFTVFAEPLNGTLSGTAPEVEYTATADFIGTDSFTYFVNDGSIDSEIATVSISVSGNTTPVGESQSLELDEDSNIDFELLANDGEGDLLTFTIVGDVSQGTLTGVAPLFNYQPNPDYFGADEFTYAVNDGELNSVLVTVPINVLPVNDPPTVNAGSDQRVRLDENVIFRATANDIEGDIDNYQWFDSTGELVATSQGFLLLSLPEGTHTYTVRATDADELTAEDTVNIVVVDEPLVPGSLAGFVYDKRNAVVANARVSVPGAASVVTNEYGEYRIEDLDPTDRVAVTAERAEFFPNSDIVAIRSGRETRQDIYLSRPTITQVIETGTGGMVEGDGLTIEVPADVQLVTPGGDPVDGSVEFRASYFPSTTDEGMQEFPGDSIATNELGTTGSLVSYGFIKLDVLDSLGSPLEVADGQSLNVNIPADPTLDNPPTIPFWYFDEERSEWVQDGVATLDPVTQTYAAKVSSVATFNLDAFRDVIANVSVCLEDTQGNPVPGYIGLEPIDKSWRSLSETSQGGTLKLVSIIGDRGFNFYGAALDGRLATYPANPYLVAAGDNTLPECLVVQDDQSTAALSIQGNVAIQGGSSTIDSSATATVYGDARGESIRAPGKVEVSQAPITTDGNFSLDFDASSELAVELGMFGDKTVNLTAFSGSTRGETEINLQNGVTSYPVPDMPIFPNKPPRAHAGADVIIYEGDSTRLSAQRSIDEDDSIRWYEWRIKDKVLSTSGSYQVSGLPLGRHTVILTVEDEYGARGSDQVRIDVVEKYHDIFADAGLDQTIYVGEQATIRGFSKSVGSSISYKWLIGDDVISTRGSFSYGNALSPGVYVVRLELSNAEGLTDTDEMTLTVTEKGEHSIYADAGLDQTVYIGEQARLSAQYARSVGSDIQYSWRENDQEISTARSFVYPDTSQAGEHLLTLVVNNGYGLVSSDVVTLTIVDRNEHFIYADAGLDRTLYVGETTNLSRSNSRSVGSAISYSWAENGNELSTSSGFTFSDTASAGDHTIVLTATNEYGLQDTDEVVITVVEKNKHFIYADAGLDKTVYVGEPVTIGSGKSLSVGSAINYQWTLDGLPIEGSRGALSYRDTQRPGQYTFQLTTTNDYGLVDVDEMILTVVEKAEHSIYADAGFDRTIYVGERPYISGRSRSVGSDINTRVWQEGGVSLSGSTGFYYSDTSSPGVHTIELNISNAYGLSDTDEMILTIVEKPQPTELFADAGVDFTMYLDGSAYMTIGDSASQVDSIASCSWQEGITTLSELCGYFYYEPNSVGVKTLTLTITDSEGNTDSDDVQVTVQDRELRIYADAGADRSIYLNGYHWLSLNESYTLTSTFDTCEWSKAGQIIASTCGNYLYYPDSLGAHTLTLTVTDKDGLQASDELVIDVKERDKEIYADAGKDLSMYLDGYYWLSLNESYTLSSTFSSCEWSEAGQIIASTCGRYLYYPESLGVHTLTLTVTDNDGLTASDEVVIDVIERDKRISADAGKDRSVYLGNSAYFPFTNDSYSLTSTFQCEWKIGGELVSSRCGNFYFEPQTLGAHPLTLTVSDKDGLQDSDEVVISAVERDQRIYADAGKDATVYAGSRFRLDAGDSYSLTSTTTCEWRQGDNLVSTSCYYFYQTVVDIGEYVYTLIVRDADGLEDSDDVIVTVIERDLRIYADAGLDESIYLGETGAVGDLNESFSLSNTAKCEWSLEGMVVGSSCAYYNFRPDTLGVYHFTLRVYDDDGLEDTDDMILYVLDPGFDDTTPPEITLVGGPSISIIQGTEYEELGATAFDTRDGNITDSILVNGSALTVQSVGNYDIIYTVSDQSGNTTSAVRSINVLPLGSDIVAPLISLNGNNPTTFVQGNAYNDAGAVVVDNIDGPIGYTFESDVNSDKQGVYSVVYSAVDSVGNMSQETRSVRVTNALGEIDIQAPEITLVGDDPEFVIVGGAYIDQGATATDNIDGNLTSQMVLDNSVDSGIVGQYTVRYSVQDAAGNTGTASRVVNVVTVEDFPDNEPPVITLSNPLDGGKVTNLTDVLATITDNSLTAWDVVFHRVGSSDRTVLASGSVAVDIETQIAQIDPTQLRNGIYVLKVSAMDASGYSSTETRYVTVDGDLKVGNFSITFEDLMIPLEGIPIQVSRTYDSRRKADDLDFGYGWSIDYQNVDIQSNRPLGEAWETYKPDAFTFCINKVGSHYIAVTLPDGKVEEFDVTASPNCNSLVPPDFITIDFEPRRGTTSSLLELEPDFLRFGGDRLVGIGSGATYDPAAFELTTLDGTKYILDKSYGIRSIRTPNGHGIVYSDNGIVHTSGKAINFIRNEDGRITQIVDPAGSTLDYAYGASGDLATFTDRGTNSTEFVYNSSHGLVDILDPLGRRVVRNIYDDVGRLIASEDENGNRIEYDSDVGSRVTVVSDRLGRETVYTYDERGNVIAKLNALGDEYTYMYDEFDNQTSETNPLGETSMATYDDRYNQTSQTDPLGNTISYVHNELGQETEIIDERGNKYLATFDSRGNPSSTTDPLGNVVSIGLNLFYQVASTVDGSGYRTSYEYDEEGNVIKETNAEGGVTTYTYDANNNKLTETKTRTANGVVVLDTTRFEYDSRDLMIREIDAAGNVTVFEYDENMREVGWIDPLGRRTTIGYDSYGRAVSTTFPDGTTSSKDYDVEGNMLSETDRLGRTTSYSYDALNRIIATTFPNGATISRQFDAAGRVTKETNERGFESTYSYDAGNRRTSSTDSLGNTTIFTYDANGNRVSITDPRGNTTNYVYNELDLVVETNFADNTSTSSTFDGRDYKISDTDQNGFTTQYDYDGLGRLVSVTDATNQLTQYAYDEAGNKTSEIDSMGRVTVWEFDSIGRPVSRTLPMGQQEFNTYDAVGNRTSQTDFNGLTHTFTYDTANDWLVGESWADGRAVEYTYNSEGLRLSATDSNGTFTYTYDDQNRLTREVKHDGSVLVYDYDESGNRIALSTIVAGSTNSVNYAFDELNRLSRVTNMNFDVAVYAYDGNGNQTRIDHANGTSTIKEYDALNRLVNLEHKGVLDESLLALSYTRGAAGRKLEVSESSGRSSSYSYDSLYRLTGAVISDSQNGDHTSDFEYDAVGNRISSLINGDQVTYVYDDNDRIISADADSYGYDANGNTVFEIVEGIQTDFSYDSQNRLIEAQSSLSQHSMSYDMDDTRILLVSGESSTEYLVDTNRRHAQVIFEKNPLSELRYTHGTDLLQMEAGVDSFTYHTDALGSTRLVTDASASVVDDIQYDARGIKISGGDVIENQYLFAGERFDPFLNKYYLRARYFSPTIGRFTKMDDWLGNNMTPISMNKYLYANADPVNNIDPSGYATKAEQGAVSSIQSMLFGSGGAGAGLSKAFETAIGLSIKVAGRAVTKEGVKFLKKCVRKKDKCGLKMSLLIAGQDNGDMVEHIQNAQMPHTIIVTYQNNKRKRKWYKTKRAQENWGCHEDDKEFGQSCDEYPMFRTQEGGPYSNSTSLEWVSAIQNSHMGSLYGVIATVAKKSKGKANKEVLVIGSNKLYSVGLPVK